MDRSGTYATAQVEPLPDETASVGATMLPEVQAALDDYMAR